MEKRYFLKGSVIAMTILLALVFNLGYIVDIDKISVWKIGKFEIGSRLIVLNKVSAYIVHYINKFLDYLQIEMPGTKIIVIILFVMVFFLSLGNTFLSVINLFKMPRTEARVGLEWFLFGLAFGTICFFLINFLPALLLGY